MGLTNRGIFTCDRVIAELEEESRKEQEEDAQKAGCRARSGLPRRLQGRMLVCESLMRIVTS